MSSWFIYIFRPGSKSTSGGGLIHQHHGGHQQQVIGGGTGGGGSSSVVLDSIHQHQLHQHYEDMKHELGEQDEHDMAVMSSTSSYNIVGIN